MECRLAIVAPSIVAAITSRTTAASMMVFGCLVARRERRQHQSRRWKWPPSGRKHGRLGARNMGHMDMTDQNQTTDPDRLTWTDEEIAMVLSARDQIASNRRCDKETERCANPYFTRPCTCMLSAVHRVAKDLCNREVLERSRL